MAGQLRNRVIVVADDDKQVRELIGAALSTELSTHVLLAADGEAALKLIGQVLPAVVVLDVQMPVLDGLEAMRRLRAQPATAGVPIVAVSANAGEDEARSAGADVFVAKPFDLDVLIDAVVGVVG